MPLFLDTRNNASCAIAICDRCSKKYPIGELSADGNTPGLRVCEGCNDVKDPWRLPPRRPDNIVVKYPRPDVEIVVPITDIPTPLEYTYDFTSASGIPAEFTYSRASTGSYYNSSGVMTYAAINEPRLDTNPITLQSRGLLLESATTNQLTFSNDFSNAIWIKQRSAIDSNIATAPDGTLTASRLRNNGIIDANGYLNVARTWDGGTYTFSVYAKKDVVSLMQLDFVNSTAGGGGFTSQGRTYFNLQTGTIITASAGSGFEALPDDWYRVWITATPTAGSGGAVRIQLPGDATAGTDGYFIWEAQLESGQISSQIPTTSVPVTRAADSLVTTPALFPHWYNQDEGSGILSFLKTLETGTALTINDGTANNALKADITALKVNTTATISSVLYTAPLSANISVTALNKLGFTYYIGSNSFRTCLNGGTVMATDSSTVPTVTMLEIGPSLNGWVRTLYYTNVMLDSATLTEDTR
jgi:hypothetical protein